MSDRTLYRLRDIIAAVEHIDRLLHAKSFHDVQSDPFTRAAFERFLEIISEASRHIPDEMKASSPETQWRRIGDIGNHLRHAYHRVDAEILWRLHEDGELRALKSVIRKFIVAFEVSPPEA